MNKVFEFFLSRSETVTLNHDKCTTMPLSEIRATGSDILGSHVGNSVSTRNFLQAAVSQQIEDLEKLVLVDNQCGLLLLRTCLQRKTSHLLRTLRPTDTGDVWDQLDFAIIKQHHRLRGSAPPTAPYASLRESIPVLPTWMGGIGLGAHKATATLAFEASRQQADLLIGKLVFSDITLSDEIRTQSQRTLEFHERLKAHIYRSLPVVERSMIHEASTILGKRWLSFMPDSHTTTLDDHTVSAALLLRSLHDPFKDLHCRHCDSLSGLGHGESCPPTRHSASTRRHDTIKRALVAALRASPSKLTVTPEPSIGASSLRNDIEIRSTGSSHTTNADIDLTVYSIHAVAGSIASDRLITPDDDSASAPGNIDKVPIAFLARMSAHRRAHKIAKVSNIPDYRSLHLFRPLVITSGGYLDAESAALLDTWKGCLPKFVFNGLLDTISTALLKGRTAGTRIDP